MLGEGNWGSQVANRKLGGGSDYGVTYQLLGETAARPLACV